MPHWYLYEEGSPPFAATLAGQAEKPIWMLTITKGGLHPAYSTSISPPPFAGSTGIPLNVPPFMPTFTPSSSGLEVLASAALVQLPSTQGDGGVPPHLVN